jgi:hypothetical protein
MKQKTLYPEKYLHFASVFQTFAVFRHCKSNQDIKFQYSNFCKSGMYFILRYFCRVFDLVHGIMCRLYTDIWYRMSQNNVTTPVSFRQFLYWTLTHEIYKRGKKLMKLFSLEVSSMCTSNAQTRSIYNAEKGCAMWLKFLAPTVYRALQWCIWLQFPSTANII